MKKSIRVNYIYNMIYQILIMILPVITMPYVSRVLGADGIGIYGYTSSILAYFILFGSLGISLYGQREIAYLRDNKEKRSYAFYEIIFLRLVTMIISMLVYYFVLIRTSKYSLYYLIFLLEFISTIFDISWFFQGIEEFDKLKKRRKAHMFNMFIMKKEILDGYCKWLFDILFELESRVDTKDYTAFHNRFYGRVSELLLDVYLNTNNISYKEVNFIDIENINWLKKGTSFLKAKFLGKKYEKSF